MKLSSLFFSFTTVNSFLKFGIRLGKPNPSMGSINWMSTDIHRKAEFEELLQFSKSILPNASDIDVQKVAYEMQKQVIVNEKEKEIELQKQVTIKEIELQKQVTIKEIELQKKLHEFEVEKQKQKNSCTENYYLKLLSVITQRYVSLLKLAEI